MDEYEIGKKITASVNIPEASVRTGYQIDTMSHVVTASLESRLAKQIADETLSVLAARSGMSASGLAALLQFFAEDPEIQSRYMAWRTARRLRGDVV